MAESVTLVVLLDGEGHRAVAHAEVALDVTTRVLLN